MDEIQEFIKSSNNCLLFYNLSTNDRIMYRELVRQVTDIKLWCKSFTQNQAKKISPNEILDCVHINQITSKVFIISKIRFNLCDHDLQNFVKWSDEKYPTDEQPWLNYYIKQLGSQRMYDSFVDIYIAHSGDFIMQKITELLNAIKKTEAYQIFKSTNFKIEKCIVRNDNYYTKETPIFVISVDMICANFNALKMYNPKLVFEKESWPELIKELLLKDLKDDGVNYDFFLESKKLRQIIFGMLDGKKCKQLYTNETNIEIKKVYDKLNEEDQQRLKSNGDEEFWFSTTEESWKQDLEYIKSLINLKSFKIKACHIVPIGKSKGRLVTDLETGKSKIKCLNATQHLQAIKYLNGQPIEEGDLKVMVDGYLATFARPYDFNSE